MVSVKQGIILVAQSATKTATAETHKNDFRSLTTGVGSSLTSPSPFKEGKKADIVHPFLLFFSRKAF